MTSPPGSQPSTGSTQAGSDVLVYPPVAVLKPDLAILLVHPPVVLPALLVQMQYPTLGDPTRRFMVVFITILVQLQIHL
jgi:hypothetical protein